jgi:dihydrofolate reductase
LADAEHDISVDGPELAAQAMRADLVDEFQMIVCPAVVGGKRFFLTTCGWSWSCSRSAGSTAACSSCSTASAGLLVGLHRA